eukprot:comp10873_c0_seq2/m.13427 comp10873_c0_seq2/g.13427  ORF comp10873_c0_seq2/g.13427 comp10873_c0_seq2/m.13427 type:complete len:295 (+) comp10873_c0_seq2:73-957(+)
MDIDEELAIVISNGLTDEERAVKIWRNEEFFRSGGVLTRENVLDYFSLSDYFIRTCNNSVLAQQGLDISHLPELQGLEYTLSHASDDGRLFVIRLSKRESRTEKRDLKYFYILDGAVYFAPPLQLLLSSHIVNFSRELREAMSKLASGVRFLGNVYERTAAPPSAEVVKIQQETGLHMAHAQILDAFENQWNLRRETLENFASGIKYLSEKYAQTIASGNPGANGTGRDASGAAIGDGADTITSGGGGAATNGSSSSSSIVAAAMRTSAITMLVMAVLVHMMAHAMAAGAARAG